MAHICIASQSQDNGFDGTNGKASKMPTRKIMHLKLLSLAILQRDAGINKTNQTERKKTAAACQTKQTQKKENCRQHL